MQRSEAPRLVAPCRIIAALGCISLACGSALSQPQATSSAPATPASVSSSVLTVGDLVMLENAAAMRAAQKARVDAGLVVGEQPKMMAKAGPAPAPVINVEVLAVLGTEGNLRAHLSSEGQLFYNVTPGTNVRGCSVELITPRCVVFSSPASEVVLSQPGAGKRKSKATQPVSSAPTCPQSCWTGVQRPQMGMPGPGMPGSVVGMPGMPMPMPSPVVGAAPPALPGQAGMGQAGMGQAGMGQFMGQFMGQGVAGGVSSPSPAAPRSPSEMSPAPAPVPATR
jgi:hypothetical protein